MATDVSEIPIIDADTHVVEPPDLWTSRMSSKWGDLVPHVALGRRSRGGGVVHRRPAPRRRRGAGDGRLARVPAVPPAPLGSDTDPGDVGRRRSGSAGWTSTASRPRSSTRTSRCSTPRASSTMGDTELAARLHPGLQRLPDRLGRASRPAASSPSTSLPFWDLDATLAEIERCAAMGHRGIVFTQDPSYFGLPELTDRHWDPMWASAQEKGLPVNFHIASGDLDPVQRRRTPTTGSTPTTRRWACRSSWATPGRSPQLDLRRHLPPLPRAQLRVGRERHRLDPVRPRGPRLAVEELRRRQGAPRVRPAAERVLPAPDLRLLLVRARHGARRDRADSAPTTSCTRPTSRTRRACRPGRRASAAAARRLHPRRTSPTSTRRRCARSSTTTPPASTTSTDAPMTLACPTDPSAVRGPAAARWPASASPTSAGWASARCATRLLADFGAEVIRIEDRNRLDMPRRLPIYKGERRPVLRRGGPEPRPQQGRDVQQLQPQQARRHDQHALASAAASSPSELIRTQHASSPRTSRPA